MVKKAAKKVSKKGLNVKKQITGAFDFANQSPTDLVRGKKKN